MHRLFSTSYETVLALISLNYFLEISEKFDKNVIMVILLQSISFVIRNTSPMGWIFILLFKAYEINF